jgi:predicted transcriptional regulator
MIESTASHKYQIFYNNIVMKYRSRTDIVALILEAANGGVTKTRIMYKAFLSYAQLKEYLTVLLEKDVLEYEDETQLFRTTEKGLQLLQMYNQFDEMMHITDINRK